MHIKAKKAPGFKRPVLFKKVMTLLECHQFQLPMRRFVINLFDKNVMRQIVLEEESSEEEELQGSDDDPESGSEGRTERQRSISEPLQSISAIP